MKKSRGSAIYYLKHFTLEKMSHFILKKWFAIEIKILCPIVPLPSISKTWKSFLSNGLWNSHKKNTNIITVA